MSLADTFEQTILTHRPLDIDAAWADEIIFPCYDGLSIRNLAHTAVRLLEGKPPTSPLGSSPLDPRLWEHVWGQAKRIVLFISDGLGWRLLQEIMAEDEATAQVVADLVGDGTLTPITSVAPSTTAAALPCIWTGTGAASTGLLGTVLFLREFNTLADLLKYRPVGGRGRHESLEDCGLDFDNFMHGITLGQWLGSRMIPTYLLQQKDLLGSGMSRLMHRGVDHPYRYYGYTDMWIGLRDLLRDTRGKRCFINVYWGAVDAISHLYGTVTEQSITEIRRQLSDLRDTLAADGIADGRTLFMLAADHGHTPIPDTIQIPDHPLLAEALRCGMGGEGRFRYLYLRHGYRDPVIDYMRAALGDQVTYLLPEDALAAGLFGPEALHPEAAARIGDLIVVARQGVTIVERPRGSLYPMSQHGGLSDREMLVPLLLRLL